MALDYSYASKLVLACAGEHDPRWDGSRPIPKRWVPEVACGYPTGTYKKTVGNSMFDNATPSAEGVYTITKVVYEPSKRGKHTKKTGEVVYYRKVEESDVEAIKKAFNLVF